MTDVTRPKFCVFDTEGDAGARGFKGCSIVADNDKRWETNPDTAISILQDYAEQGYILAAHNAEYDISVLFWQHGIPVECVYYNGKFNCGRWKYAARKRACLIIDTVNLAGGLSVERLGDAIGLPKLSTPQSLLGHDVNRYRWRCDNHGTGECIECYALRDSEIVYRYLEHFTQDLESLGVSFRKRIGAASVAIWKHLDSPGDISIHTKGIDDFIRESYHGGRVECFKQGVVNNVSVYDVTSMYPSIMATCPMPDPRTIVNIEEPHIKTDLIRFEGVSRCLVYHPQMYVPVLPVEWALRLYFPVGLLYGTFTHVELRKLLLLGGEIRRIDRMLLTTETCMPFNMFVGVMWEKRQDYKRRNDPREWVAKIILNSLYGRMGLRREQVRETITPTGRGHNIETHRGYAHEEIGGRLCCKLTSYPSGHSRDSNVLWASYITAYARLRLWEYLAQAGNLLIYCDTDSIITTGSLPDEGTELGQLSYKGTYERGTFIAPKVYMLEDSVKGEVVRVKGVPASVAKDYIKYNHISYSRPYRIKESWGTDNVPGEWHVVDKEMMLIPAKRILLDVRAIHELGGFSDTAPITFGMDEPDWKPEEDD